jgi:hypothetical protein
VYRHGAEAGGIVIAEALVGGEVMDDDGTPDVAGSNDAAGELVARRTVLRFGTVAAAGAGAAALIPAASAARADATPIAIPALNGGLTTATIREAFGGVFVPPRALERWMCSTEPVRHIACVGDSITAGKVGGFNLQNGGRGDWVEQLGVATGNSVGPNVGAGFRGLWLGLNPEVEPEWQSAGTWTKTLPTDAFDVCPFGSGYRSNGGASATLTWSKPPPVTVAGFELYWFNMAGAGNWQYRVDNGAWTNMGQALTPANNQLHKFYVATPVHTSVQIRAYTGSVPCLAPIGGISVYATDPRTAHGLMVHNLGKNEDFLADLVRPSSGNPLAWFDGVVSNPTSLGVRPDLIIVMFSNDVIRNDTALWKNNLAKLIHRVHTFADLLLMNPYEQNGRSKLTQAAYRAATTTMATTYRCAVLDLYSAYYTAGAEGFTAAQAAGLMYDSLHPSQLGHDDIAARVWRTLRTFS